MFWNSVFRNYETSKIVVRNPESINLVIIMILVSISFLSLKRSQSQESMILSRNQTKQLRGLGVLLVIVGHFWVHASSSRPRLIFGGDMVALFFVLSGFGLTKSLHKKRPSLVGFFTRRMKVVIFPYWLITLIIFALDYVILSRNYSLLDTALTLLGINISSTTQHIDYVRWFITLLLFWYLIFGVFLQVESPFRRSVILMSIAAIIFFGDYYITHIGWSQIAAFPIGCVTGEYYDRIQEFFARVEHSFLIIFGLLGLVFVLFYKILISHYMQLYLPSIICRAVYESTSLFACASLILIFYGISKWGYSSKFLNFSGDISYELFLLHGAFLVKYNPIFHIPMQFVLPIVFFIFILFISILGYSISKIENYVLMATERR